MTNIVDLLLILGEPMLELKNHSRTNIIHCSALLNYNHTNNHSKHKALQYETGTELGVAVLLLQYLYGKDMLGSSHLESTAESTNNNKSNNNEIKRMLLDIDMGYVISESNISEEELEDITSAFSKAENPAIYLGSSFLNHKDSALIKEILYILSSNINITILPNILRPGNNLRTTEILDKLESLPEHNGAMIFISNQKYLTPLDLNNISAYLMDTIDSSDCPKGSNISALESKESKKIGSKKTKKTSTLYVSKPFMQFTRLNENEFVVLDVRGFRVACNVMFSKHLCGVIGILELLENIDIGGYPFVSAKFMPPSTSKPNRQIPPMRAV